MVDEYLTPSELSAKIKIPTTTLAQWRWRGKGFEWEKFGRHVRYPLTNGKPRKIEGN